MRTIRFLITSGLALATAMAMSLLAGGCNTIEGMGEDVSAVGNALSDAADGSDN